MRLRTQVTVLGVGTAALVIVLASIPIALLLRNKAYAEAEQRATYAAQGTADYMTASGYSGTTLMSYLDRLNGRVSTPVTVIEANGTVAGAPLTETARQAALAVPEPLLGKPDDQDGDNRDLGAVSPPKTTSIDDGRVVQVFCQADGGSARVVATADYASVAGAIRNQNLGIGAVALLLLGLAWLAADLVGRRITRPLGLAADTANALSRGDLAARAPVSGPPEVARVSEELNALAARIEELLTMERENAADLSHRLRTPLTAVRLGVEALPPGQHRSELEQHVAGVERSLSQLIRAARRGDREGLHPGCDAAGVVRERVAFWKPLAEDQERTLTVTVPDSPARVRLIADDLAGALDGLIENAIAHTPEGVPIAVRVVADTDPSTGSGQATWRVEVLDQGPGIPPTAIERGRSDRGSTGLGLDIARSTAEAGGGRLELVSEGRWRGVRLLLASA
ncbi:MAG TPA: HAMP domain-containing sensor histidine kinase [Nocardioides sp.]|nr:HAMP domain-containing sensor histidine kinase [Nocardioides sp.]